MSELQQFGKALLDTPSRTEFIAGFKRVMDIILENQKEMREALARLEKLYQALLEKTRDDNNLSLTELKKSVNSLFVESRLNEMDKKTREAFEKLEKTLTDFSNQKSGEIDKRMFALDEDNQISKKGMKELLGLVNLKIESKMKEMDSHKVGQEGIVEELKKELEKVKTVLSNVPRGKAMGRVKVPIMRPVNLTSSVNGSTRSFTLPPDTTQVIGVWGSQFPFTLDRDNDFTLSGNTLTLGSQVATPAAGQTLWVLCEVLFYP